jgi:hypothetical protein
MYKLRTSGAVTVLIEVKAVLSGRTLRASMCLTCRSKSSSERIRAELFGSRLWIRCNALDHAGSCSSG